MEQKEDKYRLDLDLNEINLLKKIITNAKIDNHNPKYFNSLIEKIENPKIIKKSQKKTEAAKKVALNKEDKSIKKIANAIDVLKLFGKKITMYSIAKEAGISYNTAKKHIMNSNHFKAIVEIE